MLLILLAKDFHLVYFLGLQGTVRRDLSGVKSGINL
jgi:hypothetical protein